MKTRSKFLTSILALVLFAPAVFADSSDKEKILKAPKFPKKAIWINTEKPLNNKIYSKAELTLVYFWDYSSINCIREIDIVKAWASTYESQGLQTIWIHSPEFEYSKRTSNVERASQRLKIPFPIMLDNDYTIWDGFKTRSWPSKFLVNKKGEVVYSQVGEEGYYDFEKEIRGILQGTRPNLKPELPLFEIEPTKFDIENCGPMIAETYLGAKRATWWGGEIANRQWFGPNQTVHFKDRGNRVERGFFASGLWINRDDYVEHARQTKELTDYIGITYVANEVYAVMHRVANSPTARIYVTRDDKPVPQVLRGKDILEDEKGATYFVLEDSRLYYLIEKEDFEQHELRLWMTEKGSSISTFSFSNECLSQFDHL